MQPARNTLLSFILVTGSLFSSSQGYGVETAKISYASEILKDVREDKVYLLENIRRKVTKPSEKTLVNALLTEDGPKAAALYRKQLAEYPDPQLDQISRSRLAAYERAVAATAKPLLNAPKQATPYATAGSMPVPATTARKADTSSPQAKTPAASKPETALAGAALKTAGAATRKPDSVARQAPVPATKPVQDVKPATSAQTPSAAAKAPASATPKAVGGGIYTLQFGSFDSAANASQLSAQLSSSSPAAVVEVNGVYKVRLKKTFATREEANAFGRTLPFESFVVTAQP